MRALVGVGLGAVAAIAVTALQILTVARVHRVDLVAPLRLGVDAARLLAGAIVEELVFRVGLLALIGLVPSSLVFGAIHALRGHTREIRIVNVVTATVFGMVLGWAWIEHRSFGEIVGFHAAYNIVGGLVLGGGADDPISNDPARPTATWPWAFELRPNAGAVALALTELGPLAAAGLALTR